MTKTDEEENAADTLQAMVKPAQEAFEQLGRTSHHPSERRLPGNSLHGQVGGRIASMK